MKADVFLSHSSLDKRLAEQIGELLLDSKSLTCWIDVWSIPAASDWESEIDTALSSCNSCLVLLTGNGWGPYHLSEAQKAVARSALDERFITIAVICGEPTENDLNAIPGLFNLAQRVEFDKGSPDDAIQRISSGLTGEAPFPLGKDRLTPIVIRRDARRWKTSRTDKQFDDTKLYRGKNLDEAQLVASQFPGQLDSTAFEFLANSLKKQNERRKWRLTLAYSTALIAVVVATGIAFLQLKLTKTTRTVVSNSVANLSRAIRSEDPTRALRVAEVAYGLDSSSVAAQQALFRSYYGDAHYSIVQTAETVRSVDIGKLGQLMAAGGYGKTVELFDLETRKNIRSFGSNFRHVTGVDLSDSNDYLAVSTYYQGAKLYELDSGQETQIGDKETSFAIKVDANARTIYVGYLSGKLAAYGRDGAFLKSYRSEWSNVQTIDTDEKIDLIAAGFYGGEIGIWSLDGTMTGEFRPYLPDMEPLRMGAVKGIVFLPESEYVVAGFDEGWIAVLKRNGTLVHRWQGHDSTIWDVAVSADGLLIATSGFDGTVKIWATRKNDYAWRNVEKSGRVLELKGNRHWATAVKFIDNNKILSGGFDGGLRIYDLSDSKPILLGEEYYADIQPTCAGQFVTNAPGRNGAVGIFDENGRLAELLSPPGSVHLSGPSYSFDYKSDQKSLVLGYYNGIVHQRHLADSTQDSLTTLTPQVPVTAVCHMGKNAVAAGQRDGSVWLIRNGTKTLIDNLGQEINGVGCGTRHFAVTAGPYHQVGDDVQSLTIYDNTGHELRRWESKGEQITKVLFLKDGNLLVAANGLQLDTGTAVTTGVTTRSGYDVVKMTLEGRVIRAYRGHPERVRDIAVNEAEGYLLAGYGIANTDGNDGFRLWELESGEIIYQHDASEPIVAVAFSRDNASFYTAEQNRLYRWHTPAGVHRAVKSRDYPTIPNIVKESLRTTGRFPGDFSTSPQN